MTDVDDGLRLTDRCGWAVGSVAIDETGVTVYSMVRDTTISLRCVSCGKPARMDKKKARRWTHITPSGDPAAVIALAPNTYCRECGSLTCAVPWAARGNRTTHAALSTPVTKAALRLVLPAETRKVDPAQRRRSGPDFSGKAVAGRNFTGLDLRGADFARADLRGAVFDCANLEGANFESADLRGASFRGATLRLADFGWTHADSADFARADCEWSNWLHARAIGARFDGSKLRHARLGCAAFDQATFAAADLWGVSFWGSSIKGAVFAGANTDDCDFSRAVGV